MVTRKDKGKDKPAKVIWRISAAAPLGEYVHTGADAAAAGPAPANHRGEAKNAAAPDDVQERGWYRSSTELVSGMDVIEEPLDTVPSDLAARLLKKQQP